MTEDNKDSFAQENNFSNQDAPDTSEVTEENQDAPAKKRLLFDRIRKNNKINLLKIRNISQKKTLEEKENSLTLKEAYNLLHLNTYPPTNEEVRRAYYREECKKESESSMDGKDRLKEAKELILANMNVNPFTEEITEHERKSKKRGSLLNKIKRAYVKKTPPRKKNISELLGRTENEEDILPLEPININKGRRKNPLLRFCIITIIFTSIIYIASNSGDSSYSFLNINSSEQMNTSLENSEAENSTSRVDIEMAAYLIQKDGISLDNGVFYPKQEIITDLTCSKNTYIPGLDICLFSREFIVHNECASILIKNRAVYSYAETNDIDSSYKKIKDWSSYQILDISIDGSWTGECVINNKHTLRANDIKLTISDNGYLQGEYSFMPENAGNATLLVEGYYDKNNNRFELQKKEWVKRPSLFVAPNLSGYYNPITDRLESLEKNSSIARFSFKKENTANPVITKRVACHLLRDSEAIYQTSTESHVIPLTQLKEITDISIISKTDEICSVSYKAFLDRNIVDYTIEGNATFYKSAGMWLLKENTAKATFNQINVCGNYNGTELIGDKKYNCTYKIYPAEEKNVYMVQAKLKPEYGIFNTTEEIRKMVFIDKGIQMHRIDLLDYTLLEGETKESFMDYRNDSFVNENSMSLNKVSDIY